MNFKPIPLLCLPLLAFAAGCSDRLAQSEVAPSSPAVERSEPSAGAPTPPAQEVPVQSPADDSSAMTKDGLEIATFGAGCFWCTEAVLEQVDGVKNVVSGFMGGTVANPSYKEVCTGTTGHAEVVQVTFDPKVVSYDRLLDWFWRLHDPTSLNRQGADEGTQYRSVIFTHSEAQRKAALASKARLEEKHVFDQPIVTEITPAGPFYPAEDYHQDYYRENKGAGYCRVVIAPKLEKLGLDD